MEKLMAKRKLAERDLIFTGVSWAFFMIFLDVIGFHPFGGIVAGVTLLVVAYRIGKLRPKNTGR